MHGGLSPLCTSQLPTPTASVSRSCSMSSAQSNSSEGDTVELRPQVSCGQGTLSIGYHGSKPTALGQIGDAADLTGLVPDSRYTFKVVATNRFGDSPEPDGLRARTPDLEYSWGHQADHTAKYAKGTIGSSRGYVNRCVNDIRRRPSQPLIQWRFHPHTVHRDRRLRSTQGPSDA